MQGFIHTTTEKMHFSCRLHINFDKVNRRQMKVKGHRVMVHA